MAGTATGRGRRRAELERLIAASNAARARLDGTVTRLREEVRDPYGIRTAVTSHPYIAAGATVGVGVIVVRLLTRRPSSRSPEQPEAPTQLERWARQLLDALITVLKPVGRVWLERWVMGLVPPEPAAQPAADV